MLQVTSRWFHNMKRPLDECLQWIKTREEEDASESADDAFVVLGHARTKANGKTFFEYQALNGHELYRWARTPQPQRKCHEIIHDVCKPFFEVDVPTKWMPAASAAALVQTLIAEVVHQLSGFDVEVEALTLDASRADKFSQHVIFNCLADDGVPAVFENAEACAVFMRHQLERLGLATAVNGEPLIDLAVYTLNHPLRTYGSVKEDGRFPLLPVGTAATNTLDVALVKKCFITGPFPPNVVIFDVRDAAEHRPAKRVRLVNDAAIDVRGLIEEIPEIGKHSTLRVQALSKHIVRVTTTTRMCPFKGGAHHSNTIYFIIHIDSKRYQMRCWSPHCRGKHGEKTPFGPQPLTREEMDLF